MASIFQVFPARPCKHLFCPPYKSHVLPILFVFIWSSGLFWTTKIRLIRVSFHRFIFGKYTQSSTWEIKQNCEYEDDVTDNIVICARAIRPAFLSLGSTLWFIHRPSALEKAGSALLQQQMHCIRYKYTVLDTNTHFLSTSVSVIRQVLETKTNGVYDRQRLHFMGCCSL